MLSAMFIGLFWVAAWIIPLWIVIRRTGNPAPLALIALIPPLGIVLLWWLAFGRWPAVPDGGGTDLMKPPP